MTPLFLESFKNVFDCKTEDFETKLQEEILSGIYSNLLSETAAQRT